MYLKICDPWVAEDHMTPDIMDHFETIYGEASAHLTEHLHDDLYYTQAETRAAFWYAGNDGSGSGADADLIYHSTGNLHASSFYGVGVPTGLIVLWYGSVASIPSGWHLCDGTSGTVDLRNRFPIGAGSTYSPGATGGSTTFTASGTMTISTHALTVDEIPAHTHPFTDYYSAYVTWEWGDINMNKREPVAAYVRSGETSSAGSGSAHDHSGSSISLDAVASMPYYYSLCYIQKVAT